MASHDNLIAIVGATGKQGSSVAHHFLTLPDWRVRALTRNPSSPAAQELQKLGAEVMQADLDEPSSLIPAFTDATAIFSNTDFWGTYKSTGSSDAAYEKEVQHGMNIASAANSVPTLQRFIYSALGPAKQHSKGKYSHIYHWDSKATIVQSIQTQFPNLAAKMSTIYLGVYADNPFLKPQPIPGTPDTLALIGPMSPKTKIPIINASQSTGRFVHALIEDLPPNSNLLAYDDMLTIPEIADIWSRTLKKPVVSKELSVQALHESTGMPLEVLEAPAFIEEFGYMGGVNSVVQAESLQGVGKADSGADGKGRGFEQWVMEHADEVGS